MGVSVINSPETINDYRQKIVNVIERLKVQLESTNCAIEQVAEGWKDVKFQEFQQNFNEDKEKIQPLCDILDEYDREILNDLERKLNYYADLKRKMGGGVSHNEVKIRDLNSIKELHNTIEYAGEAMATIEENVSNYLDGVMDVLEEQLDMIREKLEEAEAELAEAEADLSSCEASQTYDEEEGAYTPSCSGEARAVEYAQRKVDEWRRKYDAGNRIVSECRCDISNYNHSGSFMTPPGGHYLIEAMANKDTPNATELLRETIDHLCEVLETDMGNDGRVPEQYSNPNITKEDVPMSEEEKEIAFSQFVEETKENQEEDANRRNIADANRAMRCPSCGLPLGLCKCAQVRDNVHIYE